MAQAVTVARPYARAAFEAAQADNQVSAWLDVLTDLAQLVEQPQLQHYVNNPKVSAEDVLALFVDILGDRLNQQQQMFIQILCESRQVLLLPDIANLYTKAALSADSTITVNVCSALELSDAQKTKLNQALQKRLNQNVELHYQLDPEIIGGMIIRTDEWVMDGSVKGKLSQLKRTLVG